MLCDICWESMPEETVPGTVKLLTPCHHRVHARCNKEGEGCQACANGKKWEPMYMGCFLLLFGLGCGYCLSITLFQMKAETAVLGKQIRQDIAQIEEMAETSTLFGSWLHVHAVASLQRIKATVKHELTQMHRQGGKV